MNWNLQLDNSIGLTAIAVVVALIYAFTLYFRSSKDSAVRPWALYSLFTVRALLIFILMFVLFNPLLHSISYNKVKSKLVVAVDASSSVLNDDAVVSYLKGQLQKDVTALEQLYQVELISFGERLEPFQFEDSLNHQKTDLSQVLQYISEEEDIVSSVVLSDGIINSGVSIEGVQGLLKHPVYTVGVGDVSSRQDLKIDEVMCNAVVFYQNSFEVDVAIEALIPQSESTVLQLYQNDELIDQQTIELGSSRYFKEHKFIVQANKLGLNNMRIELSALTNESNKVNNSYQWVVDVVESRKKIEIWSEQVHPDVGAIRSMLELDEQFDVELVQSEHWQVGGQDLVVLCQWFSSVKQRSLFEKLKTYDIPVLITFSESLDPVQFNLSSLDVKFNSFGSGFDQVQPVYNASFEQFNLSENLESLSKDWSPVRRPFGEFKGYSDADVLFTQKLGSVRTHQPLILAKNERGYRYGIIAGTGIWQWRLLEHRQKGNFELNKELYGQLAQFLTVKTEKKLLDLSIRKNIWSSRETVSLKADLYNTSLEPLRSKDIKVTLKDRAGNEFVRMMQSKGDQYILKLKALHPGAYSALATATVASNQLQDQEFFVVMVQDLEQQELRADHEALKSLSASSSGKFFTLDQIEALWTGLRESDLGKTVIKEETSWRKLVDLRSIFWLLVVLLSLEWFARKLIGGY